MEALSLDHLPGLREKFKKMDVPLSEYSFANLYLFRHRHDYKVCLDKEDVFILGVTYDGGKYIMPTVDLMNDKDNANRYKKN